MGTVESIAACACMGKDKEPVHEVWRGGGLTPRIVAELPRQRSKRRPDSAPAVLQRNVVRRDSSSKTGHSFRGRIGRANTIMTGNFSSGRQRSLRVGKHDLPSRSGVDDQAPLNLRTDNGLQRGDEAVRCEPQMHLHADRCVDVIREEYNDNDGTTATSANLCDPEHEEQKSVDPRGCDYVDEDDSDTSYDGNDFNDHEAQRRWNKFLKSSSIQSLTSSSNLPSSVFERFRTTDDLSLVFATFAQLVQLGCSTVGAVSGRHWQYPYEPMRLLVGGNFKAKQLWKLLDERSARPEYDTRSCCTGNRMEGRRVVVVGAGPCGLRAAIEMRLLGAKVTVVERRTQFIRTNQLQLWQFCVADLRGLGARVIEPPSSDFGTDADCPTIATNELQTFLLKVALLLGAEVLLGTDALRTWWSDFFGDWSVELGPAFSAVAAANTRTSSDSAIGGDSSNWSTVTEQAPSPSPSAPRVLFHVAVLLVADGAGSKISKDMGFESLDDSSWRPSNFMGVKCNFARADTRAERKIRSFAMTRQFSRTLFEEVDKATGAELESFMYARGKSSHYIMMKPTVKCLQKAGVIIDSACSDVISRENVDLSALDSFVKKSANFSSRSSETPLIQALMKDHGVASADSIGYVDGGPCLFKVAKACHLVNGFSIVMPQIASHGKTGQSENKENSMEHSLLAIAIGDALLEPCWSQGLCIVRGFLSVLDACASVAKWAEGADATTTQKDFDAAFSNLRMLDSTTRNRILLPNEAKYGVLPSSRYRSLCTAPEK
eukprot:TRINITY_DN54551_c0_g1_i1.p1 TRINITY_DN54551_c0_g1~~TRINITY_DN54551_c0_g1_i1.p1  ORF type:complete len:773 (+),score=99.62 TRINITY_DN54551_c0_g1_i1:74-2392(+)